jgi:glycosyltransferase involved in cell wall biosynthesis
VARGAAAARNRGVREAQGPWIGFLDDDDRYGTGYLDAMHHLLEDAPPSVGFAWSGVRRLRDTPQGAVVESEQYWDPRFADRRAAFRGFVAGRRVGSGCGLVVRRSSFLAAGGFDEALPCAEDTDLLIRLARDFDFRVCREILVDVHLHDGPRLTRYGAPMATAYARILDKNRPALADAPAVLAGLQYKTGWLHYRAGDRLGGRRHVVAALRTRPRFAKAWLALVLFEVLGSHGAGIHDRLSWLRKGGP